VKSITHLLGGHRNPNTGLPKSHLTDIGKVDFPRLHAPKEIRIELLHANRVAPFNAIVSVPAFRETEEEAIVVASIRKLKSRSKATRRGFEILCPKVGHPDVLERLSCPLGIFD
jgi:hypothetical protein